MAVTWGVSEAPAFWVFPRPHGSEPLDVGLRNLYDAGVGNRGGGQFSANLLAHLGSQQSVQTNWFWLPIGLDMTFGCAAQCVTLGKAPLLCQSQLSQL